MKRSLLAVMLSLAAVVSVFGQMSDAQVMDFVRTEAKKGTSQSRIVTSLMQRGVQIEQIRRIRNQYDEQVKQRGLSGAADGAVSMAVDRMQGNGDGTAAQELMTARRGTTGEVYQDAAEDHAEEERDVMATQNVQGEAAGKRVFGRDIFNQRALSFEPNMNLATPQNYVLGPGDQLVIDIYGASQKTLVHTVSPEGTITIANVGPVAVNGLTVSEAQRKIRATVGTHYSTSDVRLTLGQTRTIMINVMGEVRTPGTYHLSAFASVFHAIYRAGGINQLGTLRNVKVYRDGRLVTVVDIYEYILNGRLAGNIMLQDGDVIQVDPYECLVGITGNVKRPMYYEMRKSETVGTLIKYAGGFTGAAYKKICHLNTSDAAD
ncbi:MAG: SLBB domain-containing protein, partial [Bacteroidaceae bacterium]|nr:SLBB domain-containing protein [Bacteroidaceae bacterium]